MTYQEAIIKDLQRFENNDFDDPLFFLNRIRSYDYGYLYLKDNGVSDRFEIDFYDYQAFIKKLYETYTNKYFENIASSKDSHALRITLKKFATSFSPYKFDVLEKLEDHDTLFDEARSVLKTERDDTVQYDAITSLAKCFHIKDAQYKIESFFKTAFKEAQKYALRTREYDYLGDNLNGDIYLALIHGIVLLPIKTRDNLTETVYEAYAFLSHEDRSYDCNQASGYMSLFLPYFRNKIDVETLKHAIEITGEHYADNTFVHQTLYTKWILENNPKEALAYLVNEDNKEWPTYAILALTDLNHKEALPLFEDIKASNNDPVLNKMLLEAISRLKTQVSLPEIKDRIIWLHGFMTPTQRALTGENDNEFVKRAQQKLAIDDTVYETDED